MKSWCLLLIALDLSVLAAAYFWPQSPAYEVCTYTFGLCQYPFALAVGVVAWVGLYVMASEFE